MVKDRIGTLAWLRKRLEEADTDLLREMVKAGRRVKLARGKYMLARPYLKVNPTLEPMANRLVYPSYVSFERALSWYGLIPEAVPNITLITKGCP